VGFARAGERGKWEMGGTRRRVREGEGGASPDDRPLSVECTGPPSSSPIPSASPSLRAVAHRLPSNGPGRARSPPRRPRPTCAPPHTHPAPLRDRPAHHRGPTMRWMQGPVYAGDGDFIKDRLPQRVALVVAAPQRDEEKEVCAAAALQPPLHPPRQTRVCCLSLSRARAPVSTHRVQGRGGPHRGPARGRGAARGGRSPGGPRRRRHRVSGRLP
jgi:hypothetical protein